MPDQLQWETPLWFWGLLLVPVYIAAYRQGELRKWQAAINLSAIGARQTLAYSSRWQRLVWPLCTVVMLVSLVAGLAQPTAITSVASRQARVMLVMDISLSMLATDMAPNRLMAATAAAKRFVSSLPGNVRVGLVLFAGQSVVVSPLVNDHDQIARFLSALTTEDLRPRTELGTAIATAQQAMAMDALAANPTKNAAPPQSPATMPSATSPDESVMVVISDGDSREGLPWDEASKAALAAGIKVNTIAIGKPEPTTITYQGNILPVTFSADTLKQIAALGGGQFFQALSATDLDAIYQQLKHGALHVQEKRVSLATVCCGLALLALLAQSSLGLWRPWRKPLV
jgi:Ca-activated chloride channel homolog